MNEARDIAITALDAFRDEITGRFIDLCRGNDFNKLTLLKTYDTINEIYDKHINKWLGVGTVGSAPVTKWENANERLPAYGTGVLVYTITGIQCVARLFPCYKAEGVKDVFYANNKQLVVTHWQPLPEPPKEEGENT